MKNNGATNGPRVLFVSHETTLSGAPIQLVHLAGWLQERGWNILVATPDHGPISEMLTARGVPTVVEPTLLTDLTHEWLRERCREFDVAVANTIARWPAIQVPRCVMNRPTRAAKSIETTAAAPKTSHAHPKRRGSGMTSLAMTGKKVAGMM